MLRIRSWNEGESIERAPVQSTLHQLEVFVRRVDREAHRREADLTLEQGHRDGMGLLSYRR